MAGQRVGLFGPHDHPVIVACAAALKATGNRPLIRNDNVFNPHPSQQEDFDAVVVIGQSDAAEAVMLAHEERHIQVYNIGATVGVANEAGEISEPLSESSAFAQFAERINASLVQQRAAIDASIAQFGGAPASSATPTSESNILVLTEQAAFGAHITSILSRYVGERGASEGAVEVLERIITERDAAIFERDGAVALRLSAEAALEVAQTAAADADTGLPKVADLAAHLATLDLDGVTALHARDTRKTAAPIYEARLEELTRPTGS